MSVRTPEAATSSGLVVGVSDAWPMQHPVWASLIYSILILVVFRTLAVRKYRSATA